VGGGVVVGGGGGLGVGGGVSMCFGVGVGRATKTKESHPRKRKNRPGGPLSDLSVRCETSQPNGGTCGQKKLKKGLENCGRKTFARGWKWPRSSPDRQA